MSALTTQKAEWRVWTDSGLYSSWQRSQPVWAWIASGPQGTQTGLEYKSEVAAQKAQAAAFVLDERMEDRA